MARISPESVDEVRRVADLVELVRGQVQLTRRGGRWWGRCPFHEERTPSFCIIPPDDRRYYCYGCGATGDAITWMQEKEGAGSFAEAIERLGDRFGVPVRFEEASPAEAARRAAEGRRLELLERAAAFYAAYLWASDEAAPARAYLLGRGFGEELLRRFRVGYAPAAGHVLSGRAIREGFSREQLAEAGLARLRGRVAADFFSGRITFPIADRRGRVLGFGARTMDPAERAKYVNSPEGEGFRKRDLLFGLHLARESAAREGWTVVVEGYTDVLALHSVGIPNAVACMGTALTGAQLRELSRTGREARLCFDADAAGERAAWRTIEAAAGTSIELSALRLPAGSDPGDMIGDPERRDRLAAAVAAPEPLIEWLVTSRFERAEPGPQGRNRAVADIQRWLALLPASWSLARDEAVRKAVGLFELPPDVERRLRESVQVRRDGAGDAPPPALRALTTPQLRERRLLALALALPAPGRAILAEMSDGALEVEEHRRVLELLRSGAEEWPPDLAALEGALRAEAAAGATEGELREAALRVEEQALERRAARLRASGDEQGLLHVLELLRRLRAAARGADDHAAHRTGGAPGGVR